MPQSGFVLAGGASTRMGRDKALLPFHGSTLVQHMAQTVEDAVGSVALIGDPARYARLGYPVYPDKFAGCGPLGGIYTALSVSPNDWNLILACDMPGVTADLLRRLTEIALESNAACVATAGLAGDPEPLCAAYHRSCLPVLERAIEGKRFKMKDLVKELGSRIVPAPTSALANVNTPGEWADFKTNPIR
ncbi:MAG TPA: molybdenum cofactor guanylyltransferase [Bryobacteraceae bacterium]|nr:molybdenum cofactor guanylyltransferase [Bryobacteraceae bacterium]